MEYRVKLRGIGTNEEVLSDLRRVAAIQDRGSVTQRDYGEHGEYSVSGVVNRFGSWNEALVKAGIRPIRHSWEKNDCLLGIKAVYDKLGRQPSYNEYRKLGPELGYPCISTLENCLGSWSEGLLSFKTSSSIQGHSPDLAHQPIEDGSRNPPRPRHGCGDPSGFEGMPYGPINELGVLALFSMLAQELGFVIECMGSAFPDCIGKRRDPKSNRNAPVRIELEYRSSSFPRHKHQAEGCDLIVCWEHDWKECPTTVEVLSLKKYLRERRDKVLE